MFLSLNRRKHEMCEMVSKCLRKLDHDFSRGSNDQNKLRLNYRCLPCAIYFCKYMLKIMKKRRDPHPICRRSVEKRSPRTPALPLGHGDLGFASVDIGFLGVTISHTTLSCSQYLYNIILSCKIVEFITQYVGFCSFIRY